MKECTVNYTKQKSTGGVRHEYRSSASTFCVICYRSNRRNVCEIAKVLLVKLHIVSSHELSKGFSRDLIPGYALLTNSERVEYIAS